MIRNTEQALGKAGHELTDIQSDRADAVIRRDIAMAIETHASSANLKRCLRAFHGFVSTLSATLYAEEA